MADVSMRDRFSPNIGPRQGVEAPDLVILHYTNMETPSAALDRLCDPEAKVSAHYLIEPDGALWRLAPDESRAWHAGVSFWGGGDASLSDVDINSRSIGIELAHVGHDASGVCAPFADAQMTTLTSLLSQLLDRWAIPPQGVLGHSDVAPGRKIDPGEKFDWARLARSGLAEESPSLGPASLREEGEVATAFRSELKRIGYGDWPQEALEDAFRRRWRPRALGAALTVEDLQLAEALASRRS